jgi:20S proteasome alpha/beta subunit
MTIILGMRTADGIILAADSEETYARGGKVQVQKILTQYQFGLQTGQGGGMAIAGAGDSGYIDCIGLELADYFQQTEQSLAQLAQGFRQKIKAFYKDHVIPFAQYPADDRPGFSLLIAVSRAGKHELWMTNNNTMRRVIDYAADGAGAGFASSLLNRLWVRGLTTNQAQLIAGYAVFETKNFCQYCGKDTHIVCVRDGTVTSPPQASINLAESQFRLSNALFASALHYVMGIQESEPHGGFRVPLDAIRKKLTDFGT